MFWLVEEDRIMRFKVLLEWDNETGVYVATVPALPGCATQGKTKNKHWNGLKRL